MNLSNFYNYSILTGVWNDLDYDVFKLVKEYLQIYLNRRLLNNDFNVFLDRVSDEMNLRVMSYQRNVLKVRYGLNKFKVGMSYPDENENNVLFSLDYLIRDKYYILGIRLSLFREEGINHYCREQFIENFVGEYAPDGITDGIHELMQSEKSTKAYLKILMLSEDKGYNPAVEY